MRVLLHEFLSGGGTWSWQNSPFDCPSLLREGWAMVRALAEDFSQLPDVEVLLLQDARLSDLEIPHTSVSSVTSARQERELLQSQALGADWTVVIAPEIKRALFDRCRWVEDAGGRLLGPDSRLVALASDKQATAEYLLEAGVPVPAGRRLRSGEQLPAEFPYPAVLKPCDGAGSNGIRRIAAASDQLPPNESQNTMRLEQWHPGTAASVALLCGPGNVSVLEPCAQHLSEDGQLRYLGGSLPLPAPLAARARDLAQRVAAALPPSVGFLGVDLVLGTDGAMSDVVIEVNPRVTTSYLGLRRLARCNLAQAMVTLAAGHPFELPFGSQRVEFAPDAVFRASGVPQRAS